MISSHRKRGSILLVLLLVFSIVIVAGLLYLINATAGEYKTLSAKERSWRARLWAESAIEDAAAKLLADPFMRAYGTETSPALHDESTEGGGYEATIKDGDAPDRLVISASGTSGGAAFRIRQEARLRMPFLFSLLAEKDLRLSGNAVIEGSADAGGKFTLMDQAQVTGSISSGEGFSGSSENVQQRIREGISSGFPIDFEEIKACCTTFGARRVVGGTISNIAVADTSIRIEGISTAAGILVRNGAVITTGDLRILGPFEVEAPKGRVALYVDGDLTIADGGTLRVTGPIVVHGQFRCTGRSIIFGALIARSVDAGGDFRIRPDPELPYENVQGFRRDVLLCRYETGTE